jgi:hypothetical protein
LNLTQVLHSIADQLLVQLLYYTSVRSFWRLAVAFLLINHDEQ